MTAEGDLIIHLEREQATRLSRMEARIDEIEKEMEEQSKIMLLKLQEIMTYQKQHESSLDALNTIIHGSTVLKWVITAVVGTFAAIGVISTAVEAITKHWLGTK